jgi:hypothetical protein
MIDDRRIGWNFPKDRSDLDPIRIADPIDPDQDRHSLIYHASIFFTIK